MTQSDKTLHNVGIAKEVQKQKRSDRAGVNRFSSAYWETRVFRPKYTRNGKRIEVAQFFVQVSHAGRRHAVALGTNSVEEAGRRGAKLFKTLKQEGWEAALRLFRPDAGLIDKELTIGRYLALVNEHAPLSARTFGNYAYALRRMAADMNEKPAAKSQSRFDPGGKWRDAVDSIPLSKITPVKVDDWRTRFLKANRGNPVSEQRAIRSVNSYIRNARALFSRRILEAMEKHTIKLPDPLPFSGVRLNAKVGSTRYRSEINPGAILQSARTDLAENDPDAYAVVLLAMGAGLRRSEIDALEWPNVMTDRGIIRVITTAQRRVKSDESEGDIFVDGALFTELKKTKRPGSTDFVVEPKTAQPKTKATQVYRAQKTFERVTAWLRNHGVTTEKPIHTLRKEFGSVVASAGDIHQAQRQLRHAQISTTEQYYADARKRATVPVAALLSGAPPEAKG